MEPTPIRFWYDFVDPLSYVQHRVLTDVVREHPDRVVEGVPTELAPPPTPHIDPDGTWWRERWNEASVAAAELGIELVAPRLVPWTRKAHELVEAAREAGKAPEAVAAIFEAFFVKRLDIGRIDVLVELATGLGLDQTAAKVALDVDQYTETVLSRGNSVDAPARLPAVATTGQALEGFRNREDLRSILG